MADVLMAARLVVTAIESEVHRVLLDLPAEQTVLFEDELVAMLTRYVTAGLGNIPSPIVRTDGAHARMGDDHGERLGRGSPAIRDHGGVVQVGEAKAFPPEE